MSEFDPDVFLGTETEDSTDTKIIPVPEGQYLAVVDKVQARKSTRDDGSEFYVLDVTWAIDDPAVAEATGRDQNSVRQSIFLDVNENNSLDMGTGKNVQLGRLREALGQNKSGKAWSPNHMQGQAAQVMVSHRPDREDPETFYAEVKRVAAS